MRGGGSGGGGAIDVNHKRMATNIPDFHFDPWATVCVTADERATHRELPVIFVLRPLPHVLLVDLLLSPRSHLLLHGLQQSGTAGGRRPPIAQGPSATKRRLRPCTHMSDVGHGHLSGPGSSSHSPLRNDQTGAMCSDRAALQCDRHESASPSRGGLGLVAVTFAENHIETRALPGAGGPAIACTDGRHRARILTTPAGRLSLAWNG